MGHIPEEETDEGLEIGENSLLIASETPLSQEDYMEYMEKIDYALFLHKPDAYRFAASGVFFDAVSYLKPIIAIENPLFRYYFDLMGDIGYLCKDYEEMGDLVIKIIKTPDKKRYRQQQLNIQRGKEKISIEMIAKKMRKVWQNQV